MEASTTNKKIHTANSKKCGDETNGSTAAKNAGDRIKCPGDPGAGSISEDFLIFGARPSNVFDELSITINSLLTEEVASLPLLPRTLAESNQQQSNEAGNNAKPQTGEEKLVSKLRLAYQKNLDLAEAYCSRNIFTVQYHSKTMRRKILKRYLAQENEDDTAEKRGCESNNVSTPLHATFHHIEGEIPSPEEIDAMDKEILVARQRLQHAKRRRIQLKRQLDRLAKASQPLKGVQEALTHRLGVQGNDEGITTSVQSLKEMVVKAMEGHHELRAWNCRAEEVLQILDKIKFEQTKGNNPSEITAGCQKRVAGRKADESERKRMLGDDGDNTASYGSKEQVASLLKKLKGN